MIRATLVVVVGVVAEEVVVVADGPAFVSSVLCRLEETSGCLWFK